MASCSLNCMTFPDQIRTVYRTELTAAIIVKIILVSLINQLIILFLPTRPIIIKTQRKDRQKKKYGNIQVKHTNTEPHNKYTSITYKKLSYRRQTTRHV